MLASAVTKNEARYTERPSWLEGVIHAKEFENEIGVYSSLDSANLTINKYKSIEGFKDYPNDFVVEEYEVISSEKKNSKPIKSVFFCNMNIQLMKMALFMTILLE